jgi:superfamily II DNA or RNA helicase
MKECPDIPFLGLSATPWARGLGKYYDDLIIAATPADLIRDGYLAPFVVFAPSEPDLAAVRTVAGDFHEGELAVAMDRPAITGDIVDTWLRRGEGRSTFCFCVNRRHAQHIAERFIESGVVAEYMDGTTPREEREATFERFRTGEARIIANVGVLTTGVDLDVRCIVMARPTKSRILFVQMIGRGLRTAEGKDQLLVLDHAGNHLRLGMVTDIGQDYLDDGSERQGGAKRNRVRSEPLLKLCEECKAVVQHVAKSCPCCGAQICAKTDVDSVDGELVELGSRASGQRPLPEVDKRIFFRELLALKKPQYKAGWAAAQFRSRFGQWPPLNYDQLAPAAPSLATRNWLKSRQIAFAKRRAP